MTATGVGGAWGANMTTGSTFGSPEMQANPWCLRLRAGVAPSSSVTGTRGRRVSFGVAGSELGNRASSALPVVEPRQDVSWTCHAYPPAVGQIATSV